MIAGPGVVKRVVKAGDIIIIPSRRAACGGRRSVITSIT
jgi:hypothetical protein